jgi:integrase
MPLHGGAQSSPRPDAVRDNRCGYEVHKGRVQTERQTRTVRSRRPREHLTEAEIERLMTVARQDGRYGHRDATAILLAFRHGLRSSELVDLQWDQRAVLRWIRSISCTRPSASTG